MKDNELENVMTEEFIETTYLYCYKRLSSHTDAEDLAQEILLEALKAVRSGKTSELHSFYSWYWKMAYNRYCIFLKRRSGQAVSLEVFGGNLPSDINPLDDDLIAKEEISELNYAISRLSKIQREVVVLFYLKETKVEEIAKKLDISVGTVKRRLFDARQNIKKGVENMSNIKMGKLSYAPAKLDFMVGGNWGGLPNIDNMMTRQIFVVCREKGMTIQEIADEIGVAPLYLEEELTALVKSKFIKETSNGKYITDFLIYPSQILEDFYYEQSAIYENIGYEITQVILSAKDEILKLDFYGKEFEYNYLMWILYIYANNVLTNMMITKYNENWKGKIADDNGKSYRVRGRLTLPDETIIHRELKTREVDWSNRHTWFITPNYKRVGYANLYDCEPFSSERNHMVTEQNINTLMKIYDDVSAELTLIEEEQVASFIANGLISKKDGKLYLNMPVMTNECQKEIENIFRKMGYMEQLVDKYVTRLIELGEKHLLPHTREDLLEEYVHSAMYASFNSLLYALYYGIDKKILAIPEDYSKSAAALCLYII